jgi:serine/threonine protein kinase
MHGASQSGECGYTLVVECQSQSPLAKIEFIYLRTDSGLSEVATPPAIPTNDTEMVWPVAVVKTSFYESEDKAEQHAALLGSILQINVRAEEDGSLSVMPFCLLAFHVERANNGGAEIVCTMPRFQDTLTGWMNGNSMQHVAEQAVSLTFQISRAMAFLHDRGMGHGDIKPDNVFVNGLDDWESPHITIGDLDTVSRFTEGEDVSIPQYIGTPKYSAPEQFKQMPVQLSDVWGVGCIVLQLCTGGATIWVNCNVALQIYLLVCKDMTTPYDHMDKETLMNAYALAGGANRKLLHIMHTGMLKTEAKDRLTFSGIIRALQVE